MLIIIIAVITQIQQVWFLNWFQPCLPFVSIFLVYNYSLDRFQGNKESCEICRGLDGLELNWPVESRAITIATFIKERLEETGHNLNDPENYTVLRFVTLHS